MSGVAVRRSALAVSGLVAVSIAAFLLFALPAAPLRVGGADPALASRTVRGAIHVHTTRSDGAAGKQAVAAAARRAGLQFVVFTDHGDGTRPPDPPEYIDGVLCLDGVEISTTGGHYLALGAAPSPYPLGGAPEAVVEDVRRLGGFGVAAHPRSYRDELAWNDWTLPIDALEWVNADSEWRDERRRALARAAAAYVLRPAPALAALLDRPDSTLAAWDAMARTRRIVALAGHDAHGGIGRRVEQPSAGRRLPVPSYEASFQAFSTRVELAQPLTRAAAADATALLESLEAGRSYTIVDAVASGDTTLEFSAKSAMAIAAQGESLEGGGPADFRVRASVPERATIVALRNGADIARRGGGALDFSSGALGAYRVEVHVAGAPGEPPVPWLVSNPIFRLEPAPTPATPAASAVYEFPREAWRTERDEGSTGGVHTSQKGGEVSFEYRLRPGARVSQFAALVADLPADVPVFDALAFTGRASGPMRISVQLRFARDEHARWGSSAYLDASASHIVKPVDRFRRLDGGGRRPDVRRATSLLFVVDLTNAVPGQTGSVALQAVRLVRRAS